MRMNKLRIDVDINCGKIFLSLVFTYFIYKILTPTFPPNQKQS